MQTCHGLDLVAKGFSPLLFFLFFITKLCSIEHLLDVVYVLCRLCRGQLVQGTTSSNDGEEHGRYLLGKIWNGEAEQIHVAWQMVGMVYVPILLNR